MPWPEGSAGQRHQKAECEGEELIENALDDEGINLKMVLQCYTILKAILGHQQHGIQNRRKAHGSQKSTWLTESS